MAYFHMLVISLLKSCVRARIVIMCRLLALPPPSCSPAPREPSTNKTHLASADFVKREGTVNGAAENAHLKLAYLLTNPLSLSD